MPRLGAMRRHQAGNGDAIAQDLQRAVRELDHAITVDASAGLADLQRRAMLRSPAARPTAARKPPGTRPASAATSLAAAIAACVALTLPVITHTPPGTHPAARSASSPSASTAPSHHAQVKPAPAPTASASVLAASPPRLRRPALPSKVHYPVSELHLWRSDLGI